MEKRKKALVTAGPTYEPIDPVRFIGNRSSGKQGYAIAESLRDAGFEVTLISGPTALNDPAGINTIRIETAQEMLAATLNTLPVDVAVCAAAVSDWTPTDPQDHKIKKRSDETPPAIHLKENPDILHTLSNHGNRPTLVDGFAAETENLIENAQKKLARKNCDWILANLVAQEDRKTFGEDQNHVFLITSSEIEDWQPMSKDAIAQKLANAITERFETNGFDKEKELNIKRM